MCEYCQIPFARKDGLVRHLKRFHTHFIMDLPMKTSVVEGTPVVEETVKEGSAKTPENVETFEWMNTEMLPIDPTECANWFNFLENMKWTGNI